MPIHHLVVVLVQVRVEVSQVQLGQGPLANLQVLSDDLRDFLEVP